MRRAATIIVPASGVRRAIGCALACGWIAAASPAHAASMLRCQGDDNSVSYVSVHADKANCSRVNMSWQWSPPIAVSGAQADAKSGEKKETPRLASLSRRESTTRIYSYVEDGVRHYLTRMPERAPRDVTVIQLHFIETCHLCAPNTPVNVAALLLDQRAYQQEIDTSAAAFGVDSALVRAVIHAESAYRANALSRAGAQGLMQLMPSTALRFGVRDPFDAAQNIRGGVQYLSWLMRRFGNDLDRALAAYNSGEAAVDRYGGVPPYAETTAYVARVKALADRYRSGR